jgi:NADH-quinone oxidoreductase subunit E
MTPPVTRDRPSDHADHGPGVHAGLLRATRAEAIERAVAKYPTGRRAAAAIELLFEAQAAYGHMTEGAIDEVAAILQVPPTHIQALVGFYSLFLAEPHGKYVVHYCTDLPCALRGAEAFLPILEEKLGCKAGHTSDDGTFTLDTVMCLAACDRAPMMQVNLQYFEDLTAERVDEVVALLRARAHDGQSLPPFGAGPPGDL